MSQANNLRRCHTTLDQDSSLIAVVEMSQSSWLVAGKHQRLDIPRRGRAFLSGLAGDLPPDGMPRRSSGIGEDNTLDICDQDANLDAFKLCLL